VSQRSALTPKLLALDLDGTVVSFDLQLDQRDVEALDRARAAGVHVVACTGRPYPGALPWARKMHLTDPIVCYQGAQVRALEGSMLLDHGVHHEVAMAVVRWCLERDLHVQVYRDDKLLVQQDRPEAHEYSEHAGMPIHLVADLDAAMGATTPKVVIVSTREKVENGLLRDVRDAFSDRLYAATSMPNYIELTSPDADKRKALEFLCERLGCERDDVVAIGDGRNDQPMIDWAGLGVAVSTAPPEVRASADRVIAPPGSGGIAELVSELLR
jgi:Cof subfamily protein (haloacid dehalogenase superfamily)